MTIALPLLREGDGFDPADGYQDEVKLLQEKLSFPTDQIDGKFGNATRVAVETLQRNMRLLADGIVGENTWTAILGKPIQLLPRSTMIGSFDADKIIASIPFPNIRQFARHSVPIILRECLNSGIKTPAQIAYVLATAEHESHLGELMEELASGWAYEGRQDLGNDRPGDGPRFKGRGFVQITGRANYADWSTRLGIDLIGQPERTAEPLIASKILVRGMQDGAFTGRRLSQFISPSSHDFVNARDIVNPGDRSAHIAAIAQEYLKVL
ncbi:MAG: hypothetical protein HC769_15185 [Cyanobacteria bacterium CRU_2_1]|nr:hypothetical protein [Cyanobacteria bacterium RU_5_0]NJR60060.1 hypothetical protein [Cyanobacteria bacterium CRU_2_1]